MTAKFEACFQGHVESTFDRCSKMKNILYRDNAVDFLEQYVNICLGVRNEAVPDADALGRVLNNEKLLITGTAGAGKTMFLRWSAIQLTTSMRKHHRIPLYLEMRYFLKESSSDGIEKYIYESTSSVKDAASYEQFSEGLKAGLFVIILDAIDEVNPLIRDNVIKGLMNFVRLYPLCGMIVSTRPDEKLESIQEFSVLHTRPMTEGQIVDVIGKLDYDHDVKSKLIKRLREGLYDEMSEFLSNPLLATIMLLAFDHSADIPTKITSFYQQAFEALYQRHDAAKGAYKRDHHAGLPLDKFQNIFSTFSFQTYLNYKFEFSDAELLEAFSSACEYNGESINSSLLIRDSMESVCLLQRDGLDNVFSHRSFQEYFCALFVSKFRESDVNSLITAVASMENRSNVLKMLVELSPELFEYEWLLPVLEDFLSKHGKTRLKTKAGLKRFLDEFCSNLNIDLSSGVVVGYSLIVKSSPTSYISKWMSIAGNAYGNHVKFIDPVFVKIWEPDQKFLFVPEIFRPDEVYIDSLIRPHGSNEDGVIEVTAKDADWLVYTALPSVFEKVRRLVIEARDELQARRLARRASVSILLSRPKGRPSPRKVR